MSPNPEAEVAGSDEHEELSPGACSDEDWLPIGSKRKRHEEQTDTPKATKQNRLKLSCLSELSDRFGASDRAAAGIASAILQDVNIVSAEDSSQVIDKNKLRRARARIRKEASEAEVQHSLTTLYFDGRKDSTSQIIRSENGRYHRRRKIEEHITLLEEPGSKYMTHVTPESGSALSISTSILEFLETNSVDTSHLTAIGCDGTNVTLGLGMVLSPS